MTQAKWKERYEEEVERSIQRLNKLNKRLPSYTRKMTEQEISEVFGVKKESVHKLKVNTNENDNIN
jgi:DNA-directed RNA polymerase specialized sigma subunit